MRGNKNKNNQNDNKRSFRAPEEVHLLAGYSATLLQQPGSLETDQGFHGGKQYVNYFYVETIPGI